MKYDLSATRRLQEAWNHYKSGEATGAKVLSFSVDDAKAWSYIGCVAEHTARCIDDSHTLNLIRRAIEVAPQVAELHAVLGTTLGAMGRHQKARESFHAAQQLCPDLPGLTENMRML